MLVDDITRDTAREELFAAIADHGFPCLGAKSALARGTLKVIVGHSILSGWDDVRIHSELLEWAEAYRRDPEGLRSLAIVFEGPDDLGEQDFEDAIWERLQSLADKDEWRGQDYDSRVSPDPKDPHFSLSFGGEGFFVVGLHPNASRPARRVPRPTMIFNLHDQFERLRQQGRYERMRETILTRDKALAGDINPMLSRFGDISEARQYSGRQVSDDWTCPFFDKRGK